MKQASSQQDCHLGQFLLGVVVGFLSGSLIGVLLAPRSGQQSIELASRLPQKLRSDWDNPYGKTRSLVDKGKAQLEDQWQAKQSRLRAKRLAKAKKKETALVDSDNGYSG
jgi:gas vesicle protein